MPYISKEKRAYLDPAVDKVLDAIRQLESDFADGQTGGNLNYLFTRILDRVYSNPRYADMAEAISVLECAKLEYYRRVAGPYEDKKAAENGDAYTVRNEDGVY